MKLKFIATSLKVNSCWETTQSTKNWEESRFVHMACQWKLMEGDCNAYALIALNVSRMVFTQSIQSTDSTSGSFNVVTFARNTVVYSTASIPNNIPSKPVSELFYTLGTNDSFNSQYLDFEIQFRLKLTQRASCSFRTSWENFWCF